MSVQEVRCQIQHDRKLGQLLQKSSAGDGRVVGGSAADEEKSPATFDFGDELLNSAKGDDLLFEVDAASHRVDDGLCKKFRTFYSNCYRRFVQAVTD